MNKISVLILTIIFFSCKPKFEEKRFSENFKNSGFKFVSTLNLSDSSFCENFYINDDYTYSKQVDYCKKPYKFQIGRWVDINDSTTLTPININQFNFFLDYNLATVSYDTKYQTIEILDKAGKNCKNISLKLIGKNTISEKKIINGKIQIPKKEYDSISFPILEELSNKKHTLRIPEKFNSLKIILDINSEIFEQDEFEFDLTNDQFVLFSSSENFFQKK